MNLTSVVRRSAIAVSFLITLHAFSIPVVVPNWTVSQFQPNLRQGGRTNSVAVNPRNRGELYAASDTGGLFKSSNGGMTWTHVNGLEANYTQAVTYLDDPQAPFPIVLVTARADFKTRNRGGVWRSVDGGQTWTPALEGPARPNPQMSGYEISVAGNNVVVGTSTGMYVSVNQGTSWRPLLPFSGSVTVISVLVTPGHDGLRPRVYAAGPGGVRVGTLSVDVFNQASVDDWRNPGNFIGGDTITMHSFGRSALSPDHAFITNGHQLFRTEDRGAHWTEVTLPMHGTPTCEGTPFIKSVLRGKGAALFLDLYHGYACGVDRLSLSTFGPIDYTGTWQPLTVEHFTRDLAIYPNYPTDPVLLASNGGVHTTPDHGATWTYAGGGSGGYNALQVTGVTGQFVGKDKFVDLYFTTQDNNIWSWNTESNIFSNDPDVTQGFFVETQRRVKFAGGSAITYVGCTNNCVPRVAGRFLQNPAQVPQSFNPTAAPVLLGSRWIHRSPSGLDISSNLTDWQPFANFNLVTDTLPKAGFAGSDGSSIVYQPFEQGPSWTSLWRIDKDSAGNTAQGNFTANESLVLSESMPSAWEAVYDVARDTGLDLVAVEETEIGRSTTGGSSWSNLPDLKNLVSNGDTLEFRAPLLDYPVPMPLVSAISFFPLDGSQVLLGTRDGGIYYSNDRGATWAAIGGSKDATSITSFFWASLNTVYVSSFGRGLWRLNNQPIALPEAFDEFCATCDVIAPDGSRAAFDQSALVFDGQILGVRTEKGQLRQVFVTPGSSVVFTGDPKDPQTNITVTESEGKDSFEPLPKPPADGWIATGVVFTRDTMLTGAAFNATELTFTPPSGK